MAPAPQLAELIATVDADAASTDPLARLATASTIAADLTETSDRLVGHFVDQCRAAGRTWAEISEALGVTKQAAHKRYASLPRDLSRFTTRARGVISAAVDAARGVGHGYVGTEHLLLGLFPPGGVAAEVLMDSGLTETDLATAVLALAPSGTAELVEPPPFTPRAARVFSTALEEALAMGHNYIGTEHLLLGLFSDADGLAARILTDAGVSHADVKERVVAKLIAITQQT